MHHQNVANNITLDLIGEFQLQIQTKFKIVSVPPLSTIVVTMIILKRKLSRAHVGCSVNCH